MNTFNVNKTASTVNKTASNVNKTASNAASSSPETNNMNIFNVNKTTWTHSMWTKQLQMWASNAPSSSPGEQTTWTYSMWTKQHEQNNMNKFNVNKTTWTHLMWTKQLQMHRAQHVEVKQQLSMWTKRVIYMTLAGYPVYGYRVPSLHPSLPSVSPSFLPSTPPPPGGVGDGG